MITTLIILLSIAASVIVAVTGILFVRTRPTPRLASAVYDRTVK